MILTEAVPPTVTPPDAVLDEMILTEAVPPVVVPPDAVLK